MTIDNLVTKYAYAGLLASSIAATFSLFRYSDLIKQFVNSKNK